MRLRNLFGGRQTPTAIVPAPAAPAAPHEPLTPEQQADLQAAWVELRQAMEESQVTSFRACSRGGNHWGEDPEAMRAMAATFRNIKKDAPDSGTNFPGKGM